MSLLRTEQARIEQTPRAASPTATKHSRGDPERRVNNTGVSTKHSLPQQSQLTEEPAAIHSSSMFAFTSDLLTPHTPRQTSGKGNPRRKQSRRMQRKSKRFAENRARQCLLSPSVVRMARTKRCHTVICGFFSLELDRFTVVTKPRGTCHSETKFGDSWRMTTRTFLTGFGTYCKTTTLYR